MKNTIVLQKKIERFESQRKINQTKFLYGMNFTYLALISVIALLVIHYVWSINVNANRASMIQSLKAQERNLAQEIQKISTSIAEVESLSNISSDPNLEFMEPVTDAQFAVLQDESQYAFHKK